MAIVEGKEKDAILCWDLISLQVVARLDLSVLPGGGSCSMRCAGCEVLAFRESQEEFKLWHLERERTDLESPKKRRKKETAMSFTEQVSATLPEGLVDAAFMRRDDSDEHSILCWTTSQLLWEVDFAESSDAGKLQEEERSERSVQLGGGHPLQVAWGS
ncbi:unnamed protein product [Effrenium voratum]|uniref:Uncharacterized protein n=1 Tax=Effrenium voratum TaxID=2562239 RepID=A0AA36JDL2_9DINO|nr:unnamed protein product [Effrenium voratum]